jgi:hypothetical protein
VRGGVAHGAPAHLRDLFPQSAPENKPAESSKTESGKPESQITCSVALQYETEHAYYIRRGHGPIVVIDHGAVNGIIFVPARTQSNKVVPETSKFRVVLVRIYPTQCKLTGYIFHEISNAIIYVIELEVKPIQETIVVDCR